MNFKIALRGFRMLSNRDLHKSVRYTGTCSDSSTSNSSAPNKNCRTNTAVFGRILNSNGF